MIFPLYSLEGDARAAFQEGTGACYKNLGPGLIFLQFYFCHILFVRANDRPVQIQKVGR